MFNPFKTDVAFWVEGQDDIYEVVKLLDGIPSVSYFFEILSQSTSRFEVTGSRKNTADALLQVENLFTPGEAKG